MVQYEAGVRFLAEGGLNLVAVLARDRFPAGLHPLLPITHNWQSLILIGHAGRRLWDALHEHGLETADPVDYYSTQQAHRFVADYLDGAPGYLLYPSDLPISLTTLGELVGWSHPSPAGLGIHPDYGLWWAYRAAFVTTLALPTAVVHETQSPCDSCVAKPCVGACPAGATHTTQPIHWHTCAHHRLTPHSTCANQCLARLACPIAPQHRYTTAQISYHYSRSLPTIRAYFQP